MGLNDRCYAPDIKDISGPVEVLGIAFRQLEALAVFGCTEAGTRTYDIISAGIVTEYKSCGILQLKCSGFVDRNSLAELVGSRVILFDPLIRNIMRIYGNKDIISESVRCRLVFHM